MKVKEIGFVAIPVTDIKRARAFYEGLLGLQKSGEFMNGLWIEYGVGKDTLAIADVGETFAAEAFETPVCHMAVIQDPDGNKLMIHKLKAS
jgi:predicted enzyme related to lactoylglutathione lyase